MDFVKFLSNPSNMMWAAAALVSGGLLIWPMLRGVAGGSNVDTLRATLLINKDNALVLDVREEAEFAAGHIINARNVPLSRLSASSDAADRVSKRRDRPIVVCCASGNRSAAAVAALKKMGFPNAYGLSGGLSAWREAGLPTER
jgi:rhodanese-related sulfurtransferase